MFILAVVRVLVVLSHVPLPEGTAAGRCAIGLLRGLRAHGIETTAIAADWGGSRGSVPSELDVEVIPVETPDGWRGRIQRYRDPHSTLGSGRFAARVRELSTGADLVHVEEVLGYPATRGLSTPSVVHLHCLARLDRRLGLPWSRQARDFVELVRAERRVARSSPWILASSPEVAAELRRDGARRVDFAPLSLDPADYEPLATAEPPVAGLIGSAVWPPTANAVRTLVGEVWPLVLERAPGARIRIAGWGMTKQSFPELPDLRGVEWVGPVPSGRDFLRSVGLLLYPLDRGSGAKVKVLEAMALALPVVTTAHGAEGLSPSPGVLVEDAAAGLAESAAALLADRESRQRLGRQAHDLFIRDHAPEAATRPLIDVYRTMLDRRPA